MRAGYNRKQKVNLKKTKWKDYCQYKTFNSNKNKQIYNYAHKSPFLDFLGERKHIKLD